MKYLHLISRRPIQNVELHTIKTGNGEVARNSLLHCGWNLQQSLSLVPEGHFCVSLVIQYIAVTQP